jgi:hypothetical protein
MRRCIVLAGLMVFLLLIFVLAGCEMLDLDFTMDFDYRTIVETSGDIIQEIRVELTGARVTTLEEAGFLDDVDLANELEREGWEVDIETTDDSLIINATGSYILDEDGGVAQVEGGPEVPEGFSVRVENGFLSKKYFAELDVAESGGELTGEGEEFGVLAEHMLEDMFDFSWTITLPGEIVDSNADTVEGGSATWDFDYDSLTSGLYLTVQSQYTNWPVIGGIIAGAVVVLALVVFFVIKRRRRSSVSFTSDIVD